MHKNNTCIMAGAVIIAGVEFEKSNASLLDGIKVTHQREHIKLNPPPLGLSPIQMGAYVHTHLRWTACKSFLSISQTKLLSFSHVFFGCAFQIPFFHFSSQTVIQIVGHSRLICLVQTVIFNTLLSTFLSTDI